MKGWPLVSVTFSGGKSYHALYDVRGLSEERLETMRAFAVRLGADPKTMLKHQPVRFPGGLREDGRRQTLLYLDPQKAVRLKPRSKTVKILTT